MKDNFETYFAYEILSVLLTSFIWVPTYLYIYKKTLEWMGKDALINSQVADVVFSYKGLIGIASIFVLCLMVIFVQIGLLIIISQKSYFKTRISLIDALFFVIRRIPKMFRLGVVLILPFFLLFLLISQSPLLDVVTDKYNVQIFLFNQLNMSQFQLYVYCLLFVALLYFFLRGLFAIHFIILKGQGTSKAIRSSFAITRKKEIWMVLYLLISNAIIFLFGFGFMYGISFVFDLVIDQISNPLVSNILLTLYSFLLNIVLLIAFPLNILLVTNVFYRYTDHRDIPEDEVIVKNHVRLSGWEARVAGFFRKRKYLLVLSTAVYLTVTFLVNYSFAQQLFNWNVIVTSHRGSLLAPENSMSAIKKAMEEGAQAVEIDVQITSDGVLVLNHDSTLNRTAGVNKTVASLTYEEIQKLDIGQHQGFDSEAIPTLQEVLLAMKGNAIVMIDVKSTHNVELMASQIVTAIVDNDMVADAYVQSFNTKVLKEIRALNPDIQIGQILTSLTGDLAALDVDFYTIYQGMLSHAFVSRANDLGRGVWVWTVNSDLNIQEVLKYRINGIITDYPYRVLEWMSE
jgi:glycerophosphoryl diester phosphodiesterase